MAKKQRNGMSESEAGRLGAIKSLKIQREKRESKERSDKLAIRFSQSQLRYVAMCKMDLVF